MLSVVDALRDWRQEEGISQRQIAEQLHIDGTYVSKIEKGTRDWPEHLDSSAARVNWKIALAIIEERSGGWIRNRFGDVDPTPTALQLQLTKEMQEAIQALGGVILANNVDWSKRDEQLAQVQKEIKDVVEIGLILDGAIQDMRNEAKKRGRK